jgi:electron transfer flavoprotein-quinone oxidoreductase
MPQSNYDVVVVGAGAAGLSAAIGLARAGFHVIVLEAAPFPGAENWSGCVYFCENLAHPDLLGPDGVEALAWERRLVERGFFATDGHGLLGMTYRDPDAFRHCYTVLRPIYDHHLAQAAMQLGATVLSATTVESLIRQDHRVIGVCTNRGPLYADLVFLAEGDASHLVTREGYERYTDQREAPRFLQGIKQVLELPPGAIEERFGVGPDQGVAYEMLLRNGTLRGRTLHLNMGGFIYTNQQSLSIGLVLPADNLHEHFAGDPNLLMEWFENLASLRPWLRDGQRGAFGAKLIRGGGVKDIPTLIDDGLAVGGAASAIGIDFPYPNFTGPATAMGWRIAQAASRIRAEDGRFTREDLRRHYLEPLQQTHYWQDVEFLRRWPGYVKRTRHFFGRNLDLTLGSAYLWTRSDRWLPRRWIAWLRMLLRVAGPGHWPALQADARHLVRAMRLRAVLPRPTLGRLLLDGTVNAFRDVLDRPRSNLASAGNVRLHYTVAGGTEPSGRSPLLARRWFHRFAPVLASAARIVYTNDETPLAVKLPAALRLLVKQINLVDLIGAATLGLAAVVGAGFLVAWDRFWSVFRRRPPAASPGPTGMRQLFRGLYGRYTKAARLATDFTSLVGAAAAEWDQRLAELRYETTKASHIHVLWPKAIQEKNHVASAGLWHVCPAHVYEARTGAGGQVQVVVNFENCIKCETCWRTSDLVDWARDGQQRFVYAVHSPSVRRLLRCLETTASLRPSPLRVVDEWAAQARPARGPAGVKTEVAALLLRLEHKLQEYDDALAEEPRTVDRNRAEYLERLARYAQQLAVQVADVLRESHRDAGSEVMALAAGLASAAEQRARRVWQQRFAWAAADGRQLRQHYLAGLRRYFAIADGTPDELSGSSWLAAERAQTGLVGRLGEWRRRLDAVLTPAIWRQLEHKQPLTPDQDALVRNLIAQIPTINPANLGATLHPPLRKTLLAELGRRDPSLAFRAASHLWARDLGGLASLPEEVTDRWARGEEWACLAIFAGAGGANARQSEALLVPAVAARSILVFDDSRLMVFRKDAAGRLAGLTLEPVATLGLRGAGLARILRDKSGLPEAEAANAGDLFRRACTVLTSADLISIAFGMADLLCRRTVDHAASRVQFPGLFHDEEARDSIGKFGAVKKMVADVAARRYLIETLDHSLTPVDFSAGSAKRAALVKAVVAEALGTAPGSVSYCAGQVFGGTAYSESDVLSKFYRDAAAWRFLGPDNTQTFFQNGEFLRTTMSDGEALSGFRYENALFKEAGQRKALQAELDEIRVHRSRLRGIVDEWQKASGIADRSVQAEISEALGRQDSLFLCSKALLLRTHARLEQGLPSEAELALLRVWLDSAAVALDALQDVARKNLDRPTRREDRPVVDAAAGPPLTVYADYLKAACAYESSDFLNLPVDLLQPRLVPEMIAGDPALAAADRRIRELLAARFGGLREGLPYERYLERRHQLDAADLEYCRQHGFFRLPIPKELGGEQASKVEYYLLTTNLNRIADVSLSLTVQVNSSLGTTPVLLVRGKDLPRAEKDAAAFVADTALQNEILERLHGLRERPASSDRAAVALCFAEVQQRLEETVLARPVLRVLAHAFLRHWEQAARAVRELGIGAAQPFLQSALSAWQGVCARAAELHDEMGRRRQACDLFLRWVASGQISAFALTEPSAGSDTARVATRARLCSVRVEEEPDGVLRFMAAAGSQPRYLLDARRLEFRSTFPEGRAVMRAYYRWSETAEPALIHFDEYDYETDDPRRLRYYDHGGRRVHFTDIAQLRSRGGELWYDYWELTGSKMWITNGRVCGILCLYARTEEGVTGFIVDRHAEGLIVGKDEEKMGQCGSPTNELVLQAVRVPRENVIGLEGRGQVNALETLNVGRAGLAMSAMAFMKGLIDSSREFAQQAYGALPDWVGWRLERMEEERFIAETLAHELVGRFEHPQTKSVRLESAIAKMLVSELYHHMIETAEEIHGLAGQIQLHLVEKRKRDARVLNIYEGTNEIQRFFILKDLAGDVLQRQGEKPAIAAGYLGPEALELETLKEEVRRRVRAARETFGQQLWQNPNLQANCFLLAEAAAWLAAAASTLGRLGWLSRLDLAEENAEPLPQLDLARRVLARCHTHVRDRLKRFDDELTHLRRGYYAPEIRAAALLLLQTAKAVPAIQPASVVARSLSVLVIIDALVPGVPHPHVAGGRLLEPYRVLSPADQSALETALRLREDAAHSTGQVAVEVVSVGPPSKAAVLRHALALGVDRIRFIESDEDAISPEVAASALAAVLRDGRSVDLIVGGGTLGQEGVLVRLTAEALGVPWAGRASHLAARVDDQERLGVLAGSGGRPPRVRGLPTAVAIEAGLPLRAFTMHGFLAAQARQVEFLAWPVAVNGCKLELVASATVTAAKQETATRKLSPGKASELVLKTLGLGTAPLGGAPIRTGSEIVSEGEEVPFAEVDDPGFGRGTSGSPTLAAVLATDADGRLRPTASKVIAAARLVSRQLGIPEPLHIVLLVGGNRDREQRAALEVARSFVPAWVTVVVVDIALASDEIRSQILAECLSGMAFAALVGEPWTEGALSHLAMARAGGALAVRVRRLVDAGEALVLETTWGAEGLRLRRRLDKNESGPWWIALAEDGEVNTLIKSPEGGASRIQRWAPRLERFYNRGDMRQLLQEVKQEARVVRLSDADFIIDVGFGVGDREGYEAVIVPLEQALGGLGVRAMMVGGSRKVTEELHLLPLDRQIGQSGTSVNPRVLLAIGVSGAPQHLSSIGPRPIIVAFNRDPDAPIMTLNQRQPQPRVFPVIGDLFETVPAFTAAILREEGSHAEGAGSADIEPSRPREIIPASGSVG